MAGGEELDIERPRGSMRMAAFVFFTPSSSQGAAEEERHMDYGKLLLIVFPLLMLLGNVLVLMAVATERSLRTLTNYFLCSLAVADIMVGVIVVPFAIYPEVVGKWDLGPDVCNFYVFCDVLASTASILNLAAISVDRYIAVTQPVKYAKHNNIRRVCVTIAITWIISAAVASPIVLGVNVPQETGGSEDGGSSNPDETNITETPNPVDEGGCAIYDPDFMIYSSMISFYIPCFVTIFLYWRVYQVVGGESLKQSLWRTSFTTTVSSDLVGGNENRLPLKVASSSVKEAGNPSPEGLENSLTTPTTSPEPSPSVVPEALPSPLTEKSAPASQAEQQLQQSSSIAATLSDRRGSAAGSSAPSLDMKWRNTINVQFVRSSLRRMSVYRRETKATYTVAIILVCFLVCWVPFFVVNVTTGICIKFEITSYICPPSMLTFTLCTWLGYINSLINPIVYTIFNTKFRSAFFRILFGFSLKRKAHRVSLRKVSTAVQ